MAEHNQMYAEGAPIDRPLMFIGKNYVIWKVRVQMFLESVDRSIWEVA